MRLPMYSYLTLTHSLDPPLSVLHSALVLADVDGAVPEPRGASALAVAAAPLARVVQPLEGVVGEVVDDAAAVRNLTAAEAPPPPHRPLVQAGVEVAVVQEELTSYVDYYFSVIRNVSAK